MEAYRTTKLLLIRSFFKCSMRLHLSSARP